MVGCVGGTYVPSAMARRRWRSFFPSLRFFAGGAPADADASPASIPAASASPAIFAETVDVRSDDARAPEECAGALVERKDRAGNRRRQRPLCGALARSASK